LTSECGDPDWLETVSIEPMKPDDLDDVLAIERVSFPSAWSRESYLRELRSPNSYYFVARRAGAIIGHAGMWTVSDEAHISTLAVHPDCRSRGLGTRLLGHLIAIARHLGLPKITLEVREVNYTARSLYRRLGFEEKGLLRRYYGDTGENGVVMCKTLVPEDHSGRTQ
jgi:ribosomal-protein-alanine N-acetyltransferase